MKLTRREALIGGAVLGAGAAIAGPRLLAASGATVGQLDPNSIPQFVTELFIPPAMPAAAVTKTVRPVLAGRPVVPPADPAEGVPVDAGLRVRLHHQRQDLSRAGLHGRGHGRPRDPADLGEPAGERLRRLPAAFPAGRPDAALGQPAGRDRRPGQGIEVHQDPRPVHRAGAAGGAPARRARLRGLRRLPRGVVPAAGQEHPQGLRDRRQQVLPVQAGGAGPGGRGVDQRDGPVRVQQRPARHVALVSRPQPSGWPG